MQFNKEDMMEDSTVQSLGKYLAEFECKTVNTEFYAGAADKLDKFLENHAGKRQKYILTS